MADGKISLEFSSDAQKLLASMAAQDDKILKLEQRLRSLKDGYESAGSAGEQGSSRVEKATNAAAKAKWEEERAIRQTKKGWEEEAKAAESAGKATQEMTATGSRGIEAMATRLTGFVAGLASMRTIINLAKAEYENLVRMQADQAGAQLDVSSARLDVLRNMPGSTAQDRSRALDAAREIARSTQTGEAAVDRALAAALSASGGNLDSSIQAVGAAARMLPDKPTDMAMYAGAMLDLSKVTGTTDAQVNQGLLSFVGGMSRVVDPSQQAQHIPKALIGIQGYGGTAAESTALFAALSVASADPSGQSSGTAAVRLAEQLRAFLPAEGRPAEMGGPGLSEIDQQQREALHADRKYREAVRRRNEGGRLSEEHLRLLKREEVFAAREERGRETMPALPGMATFGERLAYLQANPEVARKFLSEASFEAKTGAPVEQLLLNPESVAAREYAKNVGMMPGLDALAGMGRDMVASLQNEPLFANFQRQKAYESGVEQLLLSNLTGAEGSINREGLERTLKATGLNSTATRINMAGWEWGSDVGRTGGTAEAIRVLESRRDQLLSPTQAVNAGVGAPGVSVPRPVTSEERSDADALERIINELKRLNAAHEKSRPPALSQPDVDR